MSASCCSPLFCVRVLTCHQYCKVDDLSGMQLEVSCCYHGPFSQEPPSRVQVTGSQRTQSSELGGPQLHIRDPVGFCCWKRALISPRRPFPWAHPCAKADVEKCLSVTAPWAFQLLTELVLHYFWDDSLKSTSSLFLCFLQGHGICSEHTRTCVRQIIKVPTNISMLVGIMMLPKEDLVVLGQPK